MSIGIMGSKILFVLLDRGPRRSSNNERERANTRVCTVSSITLKYFEETEETTITHNNVRHCRVIFFPFVRKPFSKHQYIKTVWCFDI